MFLRKLCFSSSKSLHVKTKFYNSDKDDLFLEIQIQNISSSTIFIKKVSLDLPEMYIEEALNTLNLGGENECTFGTRTYLQATEGRHYLFHLWIKKEYLYKARPLTGFMEMGKLKIEWKKELGEKSKLYTMPLEREAQSCGALKLSLQKIPDTVSLEEPFQITCKITNCTDRMMKLFVKMQDTTSVRWCGHSRSYLDKLIPGSSVSFTLTLMCLQLGLRRISGIQIIDTALKTKYSYDGLANVCVVSPMVKMES